MVSGLGMSSVGLGMSSVAVEDKPESEAGSEAEAVIPVAEDTPRARRSSQWPNEAKERARQRSGHPGPTHGEDDDFEYDANIESVGVPHTRS